MKASSLKLCLYGKMDWLIAMLLFAVTFFVRIPFRSHLLYSWDAGNFAIGVLDFDPSAHQPHPPGYPLYILSAKLINVFLNNANVSLVLLSIIAGSASVALIYLAGTRVFGRTNGAIAAAFLFASPLVWFQSEVALSHIVELPFAILATWLLYEIWFKRNFPAALAVAALIGIGGGFRQDVLLFYGPALLVVSLRLESRKQIAAVWASLFGAVLAWFVPSQIIAGGSGTDLKNHPAIQDAVWNKGLGEAVKNVKLMWSALYWLLGAAIVSFIGLLVQIVLIRWIRCDKRLWFVASLVLFPTIFFVVTSFSHFGYSLIYAPSIVVLAAYATEEIVRPLGRKAVPAIAFILIGVLSLNASAYFNPEWLGDGIWANVGAYSSGGIERSDREISAIVEAARKHDPASTAIVVVNYLDTPSYYRQLMYYLPEYRMIWLRPDIKAAYHEAINYREPPPPEDALKVRISSRYDQALVVGWKGAIAGAKRQRDVAPGVTAWLVPLGDKKAELPPYTIQAE